MVYVDVTLYGLCQAASGLGKNHSKILTKSDWVVKNSRFFLDLSEREIDIMSGSWSVQ